MKTSVWSALFVVGGCFSSFSQDTTPPVINCPSNITQNSASGQCGATINFSASATDDQTTVSANLLTNPDAEVGNLSGWTVVNGGNGWAVTTDAHTGTSAFIGSYSLGSMSQTLDLVSLGYSAAELDGAPDIYVSEWYKASNCCSVEDNYYFYAELLDASMNPIEVYNLGSPSIPVPSTATWQQVTHTFTGYGSGLRYVRITHGSYDDEFWAGQYGTVIDDAEVIITSSNVTVSYSQNPGTVFPVGTTTVTATAEDGSGNMASCTFDVTVNDAASPLPATASLPVVFGDCEATVSATPLANDNCDGSISGTTSDPLYYDVQGNYIITWTYTDGNGNSSTQTQSVVVDDGTAPVPDASSLPDLTATCSHGAPLILPTATDVCTGAVFATTATSFPITASTTIVWLYEDAAGNVSTQNQIVTITGVDVSTSTVGLTITASNTGATGYQWIDCSTNLPLSGETSASYTATQNGEYAVIVTEDGCSDTSACVTIADVGTMSLSKPEVHIYPNPSSDGLFYISGIQVEHIRVRDVTGKVLLVKYENGQLDLRSLQSGNYFLELTSSSENYLKSVTILH